MPIPRLVFHCFLFRIGFLFWFDFFFFPPCFCSLFCILWFRVIYFSEFLKFWIKFVQHIYSQNITWNLSYFSILYVPLKFVREFKIKAKIVRPDVPLVEQVYYLSLVVSLLFWLSPLGRRRSGLYWVGIRVREGSGQSASGFLLVGTKELFCRVESKG